MNKNENRSGIPIRYQIQIVQIPVFLDMGLDYFILEMDMGSIQIMQLRIWIGYRAMTTQ
jgi:hypothetical protein